MKNLYLGLAVLGFILPNYFVLQESIETGNIMLYTDVIATMEGMFANRISTIFMIDLLFVVFLFFIWSYHQTKQAQRKPLYLIWLITLAFGLASGFPLYLYLREKEQEVN